MFEAKITDEVKSYIIKEVDADLVGIAPVERFEKAPKGHKPEDILPGAKSVIVFAFNMLESTFLSPNPRVYQLRYIDMRVRTQNCGYNVSRFLERKGYWAVSLPSTAPVDMGPEHRGLFGDFSYRHAAVEAGLGQIGWNQLLVTPQFGPRVWLMAVITTAELYPDKRFEDKLCTEEACGICTEGCPQGALTPNMPTDTNKCFRLYGEHQLYGLLKHIKTIYQETDPKKKLDLLINDTTRSVWMSLQYGGGPSVCKHCMSCCPIGKRNSS